MTYALSNSRWFSERNLTIRYEIDMRRPTLVLFIQWRRNQDADDCSDHWSNGSKSALKGSFIYCLWCTHRYDLIKSHTKHMNAFKRHLLWLSIFAWDKRIPTAPVMMPRKYPISCRLTPVKTLYQETCEEIICQNAAFIIRPEKLSRAQDRNSYPGHLSQLTSKTNDEFVTVQF